MNVTQYLMTLQSLVHARWISVCVVWVCSSTCPAMILLSPWYVRPLVRFYNLDLFVHLFTSLSINAQRFLRRPLLNAILVGTSHAARCGIIVTSPLALVCVGWVWVGVLWSASVPTCTHVMSDSVP